MDYHATEDDYLAAKLRLFRELLPPGAPAVIDADSDVADAGDRGGRASGPRRSRSARAARRSGCAAATREGFSTRLELQHGGDAYDVLLPLPGDFQVSNALVAAGLCIASGSPPAPVFAALETLEGAPGRLERSAMRGAPVFVDYAHKPDALEKALAALRPFVAGRLVVVFGCGGDRDPGKRPMMGEIAARAADVVIVTDDNPRSENPAAIRAAILAAAPGALRDRRPRARRSARACGCCSRATRWSSPARVTKPARSWANACCRFPTPTRRGRRWRLAP